MYQTLEKTTQKTENPIQKKKNDRGVNSQIPIQTKSFSSLVGNSPIAPIQRQTTEEELTQSLPSSTNLTGIPTQMKQEFEGKSGFSFDDVRVHYNSDKPAQLQALAYTQGNQVHVGPGQEKHLRHELGHVVQQKQGIVQATTSVNGVPVNDDISLENNADNLSPLYQRKAVNLDSANIIQRVIDYQDKWANEQSQMTIPENWCLYHRTKSNDFVSSILEGIDLTKSMTTQLGKGFYTGFFKPEDKYGYFMICFTLNRELKGQQVFSDIILDETNKTGWDEDNDFLYTPKLDTKINGQDIPHQVKITTKGVTALSPLSVQEGNDPPIKVEDRKSPQKKTGEESFLDLLRKRRSPAD